LKKRRHTAKTRGHHTDSSSIRMNTNVEVQIVTWLPCLDPSLSRPVLSARPWSEMSGWDLYVSALLPWDPSKMLESS
jgi:hypothetical protein